jgi:CRISPR type I-D-associated protein Csc1
VQWNTVREGYAYPGKETSIGYPDWGFARILRPESTFIFYVLVDETKSTPDAPAFAGLLSGGAARIRLGKFPGKAHVVLEPAVQVQRKEGAFTTATLLNWRDCPTDPTVCDVMPASLPTRLINNTQFPEGDYYQARFDAEPEVIEFPVDMGYLARPLSSK